MGDGRHLRMAVELAASAAGRCGSGPARPPTRTARRGPAHVTGSRSTSGTGPRRCSCSSAPSGRRPKASRWPRSMRPRPRPTRPPRRRTSRICAAAASRSPRSRRLVAAGERVMVLVRRRTAAGAGMLGGPLEPSRTRHGRRRVGSPSTTDAAPGRRAGAPLRRRGRARPAVRPRGRRTPGRAGFAHAGARSVWGEGEIEFARQVLRVARAAAPGADRRAGRRCRAGEQRIPLAPDLRARSHGLRGRADGRGAGERIDLKRRRPTGAAGRVEDSLPSRPRRGRAAPAP